MHQQSRWKRHTRPALMASVALGGAALYFFLNHAPLFATRPLAKVHTGQSAAEPVPFALPSQFRPRLGTTPALLTATPAPGQPAPPRLPIDKMRDRVMLANPDLAQFRLLQRKALMKPEERERLQEIYQDSELLAVAKRFLLAEGEKTFSEDRQFQRLYRVEYVGMALEWQDNPNRNTLLSETKDLILAKNIHNDQELELRRSLAGDKVELFMILLHSDRAGAESLLEQVKGTNLEPLLQYARARYDALHRLEMQG